MGQIIFHCTHCGTKLAAELNEAGGEFECPQCQRVQKVPGGHERVAAKETAPGLPAVPVVPAPARIIKIPKKRIVLSSRMDEEDEEEFEEKAVSGTGLGLFAVALGTGGVALSGLSIAWIVVNRSSSMDWWLAVGVFLTTCLIGMMGLVLAHLARVVVQLSIRVADLSVEMSGDDEDEIDDEEDIETSMLES